MSKQNWFTNRGDITIHNMIRYLSGLRLAVAMLLAVVVMGCSGGAAEVAPEVFDEPLGGPEFSAVVVSNDLSVGGNRVIFGLVDRNNMPIRTDEANVESVYFSQGEETGEVKQTVVAKFVQWPPGGRGVFVASLSFDVAGQGTTNNPGLWQLQVSTTQDDGSLVRAQAALIVAEKPSTPAIGAQAPASVTPKVSEVEDIATISSAVTPDPDLYELSVHEGIAAGKPLVVVFSTPAFCVSSTCGPQVEIVSEVKERYKGRVNFIHVEVFNDPHLIEGGRPTGGLAAAVDEWGLPTEPWTFVVDDQGTVQAKFEQFTPALDIEGALDALLK